MESVASSQQSMMLGAFRAVNLSKSEARKLVAVMTTLFETLNHRTTVSGVVEAVRAYSEE